MADKITWTNEKRKLSDLIPWPRNPRQIKTDQAKRLVESFDEFGQVETIAIGPGNEVYNGHQRLNVLASKYGKDYEVEVRVSSRELAEKEREKLTVFLHKGAAGEWDFDTLANEFELDDLLEWGFDKKELDLDLWMPEQPEHKQPNERNLPLDIIYTLQMADCTCCLAVLAGWKYGINSAHYRLCPYTYQLSGRHEVSFVDNDYFNYDHQKHLDTVRILKPKYATVRDVMTEEQCRADDIRFYPLEMILEWAEELSEYAENVIVIPKYDCLDKIPDKFMLGYSIPTSHGGTPLSIDLFKGRRLHLLGGSWRAQLDYLAEAGDDVVSLDNNMLQKIASEFGLFTYPNGSTKSIKDEFQEDINNVRYSALALSFGFIGAKVNQLYAGNGQPGEQEKTEND